MKALSSLPSIRNKQVTLYFEKQTAGAVRYVQIDGDGEPLGQNEEGSVFPVIYLRKRALRSLFGSDHIPVSLSVSLSLDNE